MNNISTSAFSASARNRLGKSESSDAAEESGSGWNLPQRLQRAQRMSDELTELIIGAAIEVHRILGPGLLESVYEEALCFEFELRGMEFERQKEVDVIYKNKVIKGQKLDLLVADQVVIELKAVGKLPEVATAQTLSYLKATGLKRALLINFGEKRLVDGLKRLSRCPLWQPRL